MKCERCHKAEATQAVAVTIDGQASTLFVCADCAAKEESSKSDKGGTIRNQSGALDVATAQSGPHSPLTDMLMNMARMAASRQKGNHPPVFEVHMRDADGNLIHPEAEELDIEMQPSRQCPNCRMTLEALRDGRHFGCSECYTTFRDEILAFTRELQYDDKHLGRAPRRVREDHEVKALLRKLRRAVSLQQYREAAEIMALLEQHGINPEMELGGEQDEN